MKIKIYLFAILFFAAGQANAQCYDDTHTPFRSQGWFSCNTSMNPVTTENNHWIQYDFGESYIIDSLAIWNHNVWGESDLGIKELEIFYAEFPGEWQPAGTYTIEKAPASWKYNQPAGINLEAFRAQYVLFSVKENWDGSSSCTGFGEAKFMIGTEVSAEDLVVGEISVSPNPASEVVNVAFAESLASGQVLVYSSLGQLVLSEKLNNQDQLQLPIADLQSGLYTISIQSGQQTSVKTFIKI